MYAKNFLAAFHIRSRHYHAPVESAGPEQRGIQHIRTVRGLDQDHAFIRFKTVHLHQQRVQSLFTLVVTAAQPRAAMPPDCVNFVDENDARRVLLALLEQVAHTAGAYTDEHFYEIRT